MCDACHRRVPTFLCGDCLYNFCEACSHLHSQSAHRSDLQLQPTVVTGSSSDENRRTIMVELLRRIAATFDTYCWPTIGWVTADGVPHRHHVRFTTWTGEEYELPADWMVAADPVGLDNCPTCGRRIYDDDATGYEAETGQRYCLRHVDADLTRGSV